MTPQDAAVALLAHYAATFPSLAAYDAEVPATPHGPYAVLQVGAAGRARRSVADVLRDRLTVRWMVVNNSAAGVRINAAQVRQAFHGLRLAGGRVSFDFASDPIRDDRVEGDLRWSLTLDFVLYLDRS